MRKHFRIKIENLKKIGLTFIYEKTKAKEKDFNSINLFYSISGAGCCATVHHILHFRQRIWIASRGPQHCVSFRSSVMIMYREICGGFQVIKRLNFMIFNKF